ncbi:uncharacterized protein EV420DRAFT_1751597 [Desarmillaria tabescens]|uniref:Uncharacterized protein n=1 Tax=Armillaria tabescens TaxID=1929756 RepID=A0AA39MT59_ARMTA|nr:uncharacterized protein EV420DRAFT_1751597 [Desarmillaria tabescens]KAK0445308.1 hypothetical protein EV420DRAFT_1751597 [Desarmillaria tabescens]
MSAMLIGFYIMIFTPCSYLGDGSSVFQTIGSSGFSPHSHVQMPRNRLAINFTTPPTLFTSSACTTIMSHYMSLHAYSYSFCFHLTTSIGFILDGLEGDAPSCASASALGTSYRYSVVSTYAGLNQNVQPYYTAYLRTSQENDVVNLRFMLDTQYQR